LFRTDAAGIPLLFNFLFSPKAITCIIAQSPFQMPKTFPARPFLPPKQWFQKKQTHFIGTEGKNFCGLKGNPKEKRNGWIHFSISFTDKKIRIVFSIGQNILDNLHTVWFTDFPKRAISSAG
jgi:hypothetical protein